MCLFLNRNFAEVQSRNKLRRGYVIDYLISIPVADGVLKLDTIRCRRRLKACSINFDSDAGSIRQNDPLPGSSCDLGTFTKKRLSERLCRIEFYNHASPFCTSLFSVLNQPYRPTRTFIPTSMASSKTSINFPAE